MITLVLHFHWQHLHPHENSASTRSSPIHPTLVATGKYTTPIPLRTSMFNNIQPPPWHITAGSTPSPHWHHQIHHPCTSTHPYSHNMLCDLHNAPSPQWPQWSKDTTQWGDDVTRQDNTTRDDSSMSLHGANGQVEVQTGQVFNRLTNLWLESKATQFPTLWKHQQLTECSKNVLHTM